LDFATPIYEPKGRKFDSCRAHHLFLSEKKFVASFHRRGFFSLSCTFVAHKNAGRSGYMSLAVDVRHHPRTAAASIGLFQYLLPHFESVIESTGSQIEGLLP
jgi:hypothetical protein